MSRTHLDTVHRSVRIPLKDYEAMKETLEVLRDRELIRSIVRGLDDIRKGRTVPHSEVRKKLRAR